MCMYKYSDSSWSVQSKFVHQSGHASISFKRISYFTLNIFVAEIMIGRKIVLAVVLLTIVFTIVACGTLGAMSENNIAEGKRFRRLTDSRKISVVDIKIM